jgi:hypothetical protein
MMECYPTLSQPVAAARLRERKIPGAERTATGDLPSRDRLFSTCWTFSLHDEHLSVHWLLLAVLAHRMHGSTALPRALLTSATILPQRTAIFREGEDLWNAECPRLAAHAGLVKRIGIQ